MGNSIMMRRFIAERARARLAARLAEEAEAQRKAAEYAANFYERERAAEYLSVSPLRLTKWSGLKKGPLRLKRGDARQSRAVWPLVELQAYRDDPKAYNATRPERLARLAAIVAEEDRTITVE